MFNEVFKMGKIIIRGDFTLEGDIPQLKLTVKRFKFAVLETIEYPMVKLTQFTGMDKNLTKHNSSSKKDCSHKNLIQDGEEPDDIICDDCGVKVKRSPS